MDSIIAVNDRGLPYGVLLLKAEDHGTEPGVLQLAEECLCGRHPPGHPLAAHAHAAQKLHKHAPCRCGMGPRHGAFSHEQTWGQHQAHERGGHGG
jgi:hypothetical protein